MGFGDEVWSPEDLRVARLVVWGMDSLGSCVLVCVWFFSLPGICVFLGEPATSRLPLFRQCFPLLEATQIRPVFAQHRISGFNAQGPPAHSTTPLHFRFSRGPHTSTHTSGIYA